MFGKLTPRKNQAQLRIDCPDDKQEPFVAGKNKKINLDYQSILIRTILNLTPVIPM